MAKKKAEPKKKKEPKKKPPWLYKKKE